MNIQNALQDMARKVIFQNKAPRYTSAADGTPLIGVTSISSIVPKEWMAAWGAKEAVKALGYSDYEDEIGRAEDMLSRIKTIDDPKEYKKLLIHAKKEHDKKATQAKQDGTRGHEWLSAYIKARMHNDTLPIPEFSPRIVSGIRSFQEWESIHVKEWAASEAIVACPEKGYAGTLDAIAILKDESIALIDFKFASHVSLDYHLQTAGYQYTFEPYNIPFSKRIILRFPKTEYLDEWNPNTKQYAKVENKFEAYTIPTAYEGDRNAFLAAIPVVRWVHYCNAITNA